MLSRLIIYTPIRMVGPFLPAFARGLGVDLATISLAITASMSTSALAPFLAPIAERRGRRVGMLVGCALFTAGALVLMLWHSVTAFFLMLFLINLGNNVFSPAMQAYLGDRTSYSQRGRVIGLTELSWALAFILGIPLIGVLIQAFGWQSPFIAFFIAGVAITALIAWALPTEKSAPHLEENDLLSHIRLVLKSPAAVCGLLMGVCILAGNTTVSLVFGAWMEDSFHLQAAALGLVASAIGFSELGGEALVALAGDRLGKRRLLLGGLLANGVIALLLLLVGKSFIAALIWMIGFYLTFELSMVSLLPIMTEVLPSARATVMALFFSMVSLGIALSGLLAPFFYRWGIATNALVSVVFDLLALFLLRWVQVREGVEG